MSGYTPIFIPLTEGLDQSKEATLGGKELTVAENVDYIVNGQICGRPGRGVPDLFLVRDPASASEAAPAYLTAAAFASTGFTANGIMSYRDASGVRPLLGTNGRLFVHEGTQWKDRGHFACMKVDRLHPIQTHAPTAADLKRVLVGPDFAQYRVPNIASNKGVALLNKDTFSFEQQVTLAAEPGQGTMARSSANLMTAAVHVGAGTNNLVLLVRLNGASSITAYSLAADAAIPTGDGDAPVVCCDQDSQLFYVIYQTTTANQYKVLRVTNIGGVSATYTGSLTGIHGHWVANSAVADDRVVLGLTNASGLTVKVLNATTLADIGVDSTHGSVNCNGKEVVVGWESTSRVWWCYRSFNNASLTSAGTYIGVANPSSGAVVSPSLTLLYGYSASAFYNSQFGCSYHPLTQPMLIGGRVYLTLCMSGFSRQYQITDLAAVGNWVTLDLSNLHAAASGPGPFARPTLVAQGGMDKAVGALPSVTVNSGVYQPESAVLTADGRGFMFPERVWNTYRLGYNSTTLGETSVTYLTRVSLSGPRAARSGLSTILSGSVPHALSGDTCREQGFIMERPRIQVRDGGTGAFFFNAGSYTVQVCYMYMDGAGQIHRSAPSDAVGVSVASNFSKIEVFVTNPYMTERPPGDVQIEVYCTVANPTANALRYLQATVSENTSAGCQLVSLGSTAAHTATTKSMYTDADEFIHVTPSCDGGIATLGRRVWVSDGQKAYASLLVEPGKGVCWNDEGSLEVPLPAGAGRVMALEALDDKLVIFCERGVWLATDGGPNNVGDGPDLAFPIPLTDLGCAGPRSTCVTDRGVVFCSPLDATHPERGGPWLLDRSFSLTDRKFLGQPAYSYLASDSWVPDLGFSYERQQLYITIPQADSDGNSGILVIDFRASKWATWSHNVTFQGTVQNLEVVDGVLWTLGDDVAGFSEAAGIDEPNGDQQNLYRMRVVTSHLHADGRDGLGWSRVRSLSLMEADGASAHTFKFAATLDQSRLLSSGAFNLAVPNPLANATQPSVTIDSCLTVTAIQAGIELNGWQIRMVNGGTSWRRAPRVDVDATTQIVTCTYDRQAGNTHFDAVWSEIVAALENTGMFTCTLLVPDATVTTTAAGFWTLSGGSAGVWPGNRMAPEWRLPVQKCSTIQVELLAYPAYARWSAIRLDVAPLPTKAPAYQRK